MERSMDMNEQIEPISTVTVEGLKAANHFMTGNDPNPNRKTGSYRKREGKRQIISEETSVEELRQKKEK
jgi:hypothetical protein